jgi:hypothetical protein
MLWPQDCYSEAVAQSVDLYRFSAVPRDRVQADLQLWCEAFMTTVCYNLLHFNRIRLTTQNSANTMCYCLQSNTLYLLMTVTYVTLFGSDGLAG